MHIEIRGEEETGKYAEEIRFVLNMLCEKDNARALSSSYISW